MTTSTCKFGGIVNQRTLKGETFLNRWRIQGKLKTQSPLHLGDGGSVTVPGVVAKTNDGTVKDVLVNSVAKDAQGRAYIPGSSLKGALRSYLLQVFRSQPPTEGGVQVAAIIDFESKRKDGKKQDVLIGEVKKSASWLEFVFGTTITGGKIEVWDSLAEEDFLKNVGDHVSLTSGKPPFWRREHLTYVDHAVAIDPDTLTAMDKRLYHFEVVPPGVTFEVNISGQNLAEEELGLILFGLEAFNSEIWPLTIGAMAGRGFGRCKWELTNLYCLEAGGLKDWVKTAIETGHAGYKGLKVVPPETKDEKIKAFKDALASGLKGAL